MIIMASDEQQSKKLYNSQFALFVKNQFGSKTMDYVRKLTTREVGNVKNKKVLFAGCGDGVECISIAQSAQVTGVDISDKCIEAAKKNCPKATFFVSDFEKTMLPSKSFDVIVSMFAVMYKKDLVPVLKEF